MSALAYRSYLSAKEKRERAKLCQMKGGCWNKREAEGAGPHFPLSRRKEPEGEGAARRDCLCNGISTEVECRLERLPSRPCSPPSPCGREGKRRERRVGASVRTRGRLDEAPKPG